MAGNRPDVEAIFFKSRQMEPVPQAAYLAEVCGDDAELRQRVEHFLSAEAKLGSFLESPAVPLLPTVDESIHGGPGTFIGPFKLLQQIGEGGMGTVFMAEQTEPVRRKVALKIIKAGMDSKQVIARFEGERQALAMMDHVNIARVFDGGATENGRPYFVMELVHGVPITKYCDDNHLTPRERLELFVPVCQAIQHAHQKGIIHRDIKPSNVMVTLYDGKPVPKVIDFGVAKATEQKLTERTLFTQYGTMVGTLEYMSPEQAEMSALGVDTRSDIFSLGVLLYELLTGSTPLTYKRLKEAAFGEILRMIREEEPPKPSTRLSDSGEALASISALRKTEPSKLTKLVRGELDWIVMKCLEKDRNRRYETANGFAMDVQRYLNDETVQACPPSASYRLRKFVRRNRGPVVAVTVILIALLFGFAGTSIGLVRAVSARCAESEQRQIAENKRQEAEAEKARAEKAEADTLASYRASTDDAIEQLIGSRPEVSAQEEAYLQTTLTRWQAFADRQGDDMRSRSIRAEGHFQVAHLWQRLGRLGEARGEYEKSRSLREKLVEQNPATPLYRQDLAGTLNNLGKLLAGLGQWQAGLAEFEKARDLQIKLVEQYLDDREYQQNLATTQNNLGNILSDLGQPAAAQVEYEKARDLQQKLVDLFPTVQAYQFELSGTHHNLGRLLVSRRQLKAGRAEYEKARDLGMTLVDRHPAVPRYQMDLAGTHNNLGNLFADFDEWQVARVEYEKARVLLKKLAVEYPSMPAYRNELANNHNNLGNMLADLGEAEAARAECEKARDLYKTLTEQHPTVPSYQWELAMILGNLGNRLANVGQPKAARAEYEKARDLQKKLVDKYPALPEYQAGLARTHNNLGLVLVNHGELKAARTEFEKAHVLYTKLAGEQPGISAYRIDLGGTYGNLAEMARAERRPSEGLPWYDKAIAILAPLHRAEPRDARVLAILRNIHGGRATALDNLKRHADAVQDWDRAVDLSPPMEQPGVRALRANSRLQAGQVAEAVAEVDELTKSPNGNADQWYNFACFYSVASSKDPVKKQEYADRAMVFLQKAVKAGDQDAAHMAKDTDLDSLRGREDFKKLLDSLLKPKPES